MYRFIFIVGTFLLLFSVSRSAAQTTHKVLFLGNSYTGVNNLPQLVSDLALSAGDTLIFDSHTPGGHTLSEHSGDATSQGKIAAGGWHYIVLQGQSQEPITHWLQFMHGAHTLQRLIDEDNPCGVTMLYMTWGRKNGDPTNCTSFPVMCTYEGMDSTLRHRYLDLAEDLNAEIAPVSVVWRHLRQNNPGIELYQADGSHPSKAGSYAAACAFYAAIFKKDPTAITFNFGLPATDAATIRKAAKTEVFDRLNSWDFKQLPVSDFQFQIGPGVNEVMFRSLNRGVSQTYLWELGDGDTSLVQSPTHSYASNGTYTVTLTTTNCDLEGTHTSTTDTVIEFCSHTPTITTAHPWLCHFDTLWTQPADTYQWYSWGAPIPETRQFLPNYQRYGGSNFSVNSTVNGCAELSKVFTESPEWPGYFFDSAFGGDPCEGDTALFVVQHFNGSLPDSTIIHWYRDGALLPGANNQDTLQITSQGSYYCQVINPGSKCPLDTTTSVIVEYDCGIVGRALKNAVADWKVYPNPASGFITVELPNNNKARWIQIYSATGRLVKMIKAMDAVIVDVAGLPSGLYYIRPANSRAGALKFVKE